MDGTKCNAIKVWIRHKKIVSKASPVSLWYKPRALPFAMSSISPSASWHRKVTGLNCASRGFYTQELNVSFNFS